MLRTLGGSKGSNPVYNSSVLKVRLCDRISIFISLLSLKKKRKKEKKKWKYTKEICSKNSTSGNGRMKLVLVSFLNSGRMVLITFF